MIILIKIRWKFGFTDMLRCPDGLARFQIFLESEYAAENLKFYLQTKRFKFGQSDRMLNVGNSVEITKKLHNNKKI